ncbi:MAG: DUF4159 domain-containing protein [Pseudomonadota bacterium]
MWTIGPVGFAAPWLLLGLIALPVLWFLLRVVPPAPIRRRFPGVALLLGLEDEENETDKTPWWLLLLRMAAIAAVILGFAGPVLNPQDPRTGAGPLLVVLDGTWADARDWPQRIDRVEALLDEAVRDGRPVAVTTLTDLPPGDLPFQSPEAWRAQLPGVQPSSWLPDASAIADWTGRFEGTGFDTFWLSDGVARPWRDDLLTSFEGEGSVTAFESARPVYAVRPPVFDNGTIRLTVLRARMDGPATQALTADGTDPNGIPRALAVASADFAPGEAETEIALSLPPELRNRVTGFTLDGIRSAGAVTLSDDSLRRREVALIAGADDREGLELLSQTHFLQQALEPTADLIDGTLADLLLANPDALILADVATISGAEAGPLLEWVDGGGLLVRFAGPRLAASDVSRTEEDPLMPVRLRAGGRTVGGAMSWGEPKSLRPFSETSPFFGLSVPEEVRVSAQVMAQPDPALAQRTIASLADGTPLVTRKRIGEGQVVLFHVTANAEWSTLPLSGLFVEMLERLAVSTRAAEVAAEDLAGTVWQPEKVITAFGEIEDADTLPGVAGERLAEAVLGPDLPPGLYSGGDRRIALNAVGPDTILEPATWPARIPVEGLSVAEETDLKGYFLSAALLMLMVDILASLWLAGRLTGPRSNIAALLIAALLLAPRADAQTTDQDAFALTATTDVVLAHVVTGDQQLDEVVHAGLRGLSLTLERRTSVEPAEPIAVDLEMDELAFFPFLYWPVTPDQPLPSAEAYAKLNRYLRTGGMILFDTRDANVAGFGGSSPNGRKLQQLARSLDIPPLEPIPTDHVLTRTFYLLQDFPGRFASRDVWVEAAPPDAEQAEGMPFRNLNDNVTPVVIGGNDWASAWATDANGANLFPVGRGYAGERQREIAYRFGVNLVMHVLTGNYKSDQVHVPALLDRLGQ